MGGIPNSKKNSLAARMGGETADEGAFPAQMETNLTGKVFEHLDKEMLT